MVKILQHSFFNQPAEKVAQELLGCTLCIKIHGKVHRYIIHETEAYVGPHDLASHASKGRTLRTEAMFQKPGTLYIYLVYGMYTMLNIVTGEAGYPAAVLIRGAGEYTGPGKLTKAFCIKKTLNGAMLGKKTGIWVEAKVEPMHKNTIVSTPRIGVAYAKEWANKKLRFILT